MHRVNPSWVLENIISTILRTSFPTERWPCKNQAEWPFCCPNWNVKKWCICTQPYQHVNDTGHRTQKTEMCLAIVITWRHRRTKVAQLVSTRSSVQVVPSSIPSDPRSLLRLLSIPCSSDSFKYPKFSFPMLRKSVQFRRVITTGQSGASLNIAA